MRIGGGKLEDVFATDLGDAPRHCMEMILWVLCVACQNKAVMRADLLVHNIRFNTPGARASVPHFNITVEFEDSISLLHPSTQDNC